MMCETQERVNRVLTSHLEAESLGARFLNQSHQAFLMAMAGAVLGNSLLSGSNQAEPPGAVYWARSQAPWIKIDVTESHFEVHLCQKEPTREI